MLYFVYSEGAQRSTAEKDSPRGFFDSGDLALISQLSEADTADAVVAEICMGAAANLAAIIVASGELGLTLLLYLH